MIHQDPRKDTSNAVPVEVDAPRTVTVVQGAQPSFGGVDVGVVIAGLKEGVPTARLWLRSATEATIVDVPAGDGCDLFGAGTLHVDEVLIRDDAHPKDRVTLTWRPRP